MTMLDTPHESAPDDGARWPICSSDAAWPQRRDERLPVDSSRRRLVLGWTVTLAVLVGVVLAIVIFGSPGAGAAGGCGGG